MEGSSNVVKLYNWIDYMSIENEQKIEKIKTVESLYKSHKRWYNKQNYKKSYEKAK